jgi:hypothetical protein
MNDEVNVLDFSSYNKTANEILNNSIESNSESSISNHLTYFLKHQNH